MTGAEEPAAGLVTVVIGVVVTFAACWLIEKELAWRRRRPTGPLADLTFTATPPIVEDPDPDA